MLPGKTWIRQITNASGLVKEIRMTYQIMAKGAGRSSGFAVELTGLPSTTAQSTTLNDTSLAQSGAANGDLAFRLFNDSSVEAPKPTGYSYVNTVKSQQPAVTGKIFQLNIVITTPFNTSLLKYPAPYNPFIFHKEATGEEIHLPGFQPTTAADISKFGTQDDNTNPSVKRYYISKLGFPWALNLPQGWKWPTERTDIVTAYPDFKAWAESGGTLKLGWYQAPSSNTGYTY